MKLILLLNCLVEPLFHSFTTITSYSFSSPSQTTVISSSLIVLILTPNPITVLATHCSQINICQIPLGHLSPASDSCTSPSYPKGYLAAFHKHLCSYYLSCSPQEPLPHPIIPISRQDHTPCFREHGETLVSYYFSTSPPPPWARCLLSFTSPSFLPPTLNQMCSFILPDSQISIANVCLAKQPCQIEGTTALDSYLRKKQKRLVIMVSMVTPIARPVNHGKPRIIHA